MSTVRRSAEEQFTLILDVEQPKAIRAQDVYNCLVRGLPKVIVLFIDMPLSFWYTLISETQILQTP